MQKDKTNRLIYSASDLVNFTLCPSVTLYDLQHRETPLEKAEEDPYAQILQEKGIAHETRYLDRLKKTGRAVADIAALAGMPMRSPTQNCPEKQRPNISSSCVFMPSCWNIFREPCRKKSAFPACTR